MTSCTDYTQEFISRFVDNEVSEKERNAFVHHMAGCASCTEKVSKFRQLSISFDGHIENQALKIQNDMPPISLDWKKETARARWRTKKGFTLKLASLGTAAVIMAVALFPWAGKTVNEPSAIVNSVDTAGSSVMIIDTPDTQHTIIWFSET